MFRSLIFKTLVELDEKFPELTDDEKKALTNRDSPILKYEYLC